MIGVFAGSIVAILFNNILMRMAGSDGVASITIMLYVQELFNAVYRGYATGIAPVISYNFGRDDSVRLKRIHSISTKVILLASFVLTSVCVLCLHRLWLNSLPVIISPFLKWQCMDSEFLR